ncbi:helix-turn-helix domain-containing protein [Candidatus Palauibacter sp.]|uniref:helix-turn-helix domain-containing protein n=1 Tax=Candidatus Palauibacter sp. TaxID=3101350 RepID=UPI003B5B2ACB
MKYNVRLGLRLKAARERAGLTQQELATALGLKHRQTIASIEAGVRRLSAQELITVMSVLDVDLDYLTDSFRLVGEAQFSFRTSPDIEVAALDQFEDRAGRWIALYRELSVEQGQEHQWLRWQLALTARSSFEEAQVAGEWVADRWQLGSCPAQALRSAMENHAAILVLDVDAPRGISGAASCLPELKSALVNRRDPTGRRNFNLAHELFHLLTWDTMPPERMELVEIPQRGNGWRVERLAENFAAALLMPETILRDHWEQQAMQADIHNRLNEAAAALRVSGVACKWRLFNLGLLSKTDLAGIDDRCLAANGRLSEVEQDDLPFSRPFIDRVAAALDTGRLSVKRTASLLDLRLPELASLLGDYGHRTYFEA